MEEKRNEKRRRKGEPTVKGKGRTWKRKYKLIEIKTNTKGWHEVELISINKGGTITIRLPSGEILIRKMVRIRFGRTKRVRNLLKEGNKRSLKYLKTKKKRRRGKKPKKRFFKKVNEFGKKEKEMDQRSHQKERRIYKLVQKNGVRRS